MRDGIGLNALFSKWSAIAMADCPHASPILQGPIWIKGRACTWESCTCGMARVFDIADDEWSAWGVEWPEGDKA